MITFDPLWRTLKCKEMNKGDLQKLTGLSSSTVHVLPETAHDAGRYSERRVADRADQTESPARDQNHSGRDQYTDLHGQVSEFRDNLPRCHTSWYFESRVFNVLSVFYQKNMAFSWRWLSTPARWLYFTVHVALLERFLQSAETEHQDSGKQWFTILRPFAWIYQAFRIMGIFLQSKMTPKRFAEQRRKGLEQRKLLDELGLSVDRTIH